MSQVNAMTNDQVLFNGAMLGYLYFEENKGSVPAVDSDIIKRGLNLGMVVGQILFGVLGDTWGRHTHHLRQGAVDHHFRHHPGHLDALEEYVLRGRYYLDRCLACGDWCWYYSWSVLPPSLHWFRVTSKIDYPLSSTLSAEKSP
jgi:hypothetical protein